MKKNILIFTIGLASLFIVFLSQSFAQNKTYQLQGIVYDESQTPVENASVSLLGTQKIVFTDSLGQFTLESAKKCNRVKVESDPLMQMNTVKVCAGTLAQITLKSIQLLDSTEEEIQVDETYEYKIEKSVSHRAKGSRKLAYESAPMSVVAPSIVADPYLNHNTEDYGLINENRFLRSSDNPLSTFSIDVDAASYSNMRRFIQNGQQPPKDAIRVEEMINYFNYDHPQPKGDDPFSSTMEITACPWAPEHYLLQVSLQGEKIPTENLPASNLVFLIDVSGSMSSANKLPLLKSSFKLLTNQLRPEDRVAIVVYAGAAGVVLEPTPGDQKQKIKDALNKLEAGGSTAGGAGIELAYKLAKKHFIAGGNNRVILATDGDFNVGESSDAGLVRLIEEKRESGVFLTVLGFGMGNYKDNKMQELAGKGNGNHAYIDNITEARKILLNEFGGTMFTIAKDVKLQLEFNPAKVAGYRLIGYENRLLNKEDFKDDQKDAGELGSGHTVTALYEIIPVGVESDFLADADKLKYQQPTTATSSTKEWLTLKLRYKEPQGSKSKELEHVFDKKVVGFQNASENLRWACAVAQFGLLLRNSEFRQDASYQKAIEIAKSAIGEDKEGYRAECIRLMIAMYDLNEPVSVKK